MKISSGDFWKGIFLKFRDSATLVVVSVIVGIVVPKAIPHCMLAPMVHMHTLMYYLRLICT